MRTIAFIAAALALAAAAGPAAAGEFVVGQKGKPRLWSRSSPCRWATA